MIDPFIIVLGDIKYQLKSEISVRTGDNGSTIEISLKLPDNYPITAFAQHKEIEKAYLQISFGDPKDQTSSAYIDYISVTSNYADHNATGEEKKALKGIGKQMIKTAIMTGLADKKLTLEQKIKVCASGGRYTEEEVGVYMKDPKDTMVAFEKQFPDAFRKLYDNVQTRVEIGCISAEEATKEIIKTCCQIINNNKLVEYYKKYGFQQVGENGVAVMMETTIQKIVESFE